VKDCGVLPLQHVIDYEALLSALRDGANAAQFLRDELPFMWRDRPIRIECGAPLVMKSRSLSRSTSAETKSKTGTAR
jgi:hypothetical protein